MHQLTLLRRRRRRTTANKPNNATISSQVEGHVTYLAPGGEPHHQSPDANDVTVIGTSNGSQMNSNSRSGEASLEPHYLTPQEASTNHYDALQRSERDSEVLNVYNEGFDYYDRPIEVNGGRRPNDALPLVPTVCPPGSGDTPGYIQLLDERRNHIPRVNALGYIIMDSRPVAVVGETIDSKKHVYSSKVVIGSTRNTDTQSFE
ncbi:hypothetical protein PoB_000094600 [Plakobranchus ocellatus]|uniref:Uncharacterized protein n=1 Tax=Plakobranchus ocellatus TaxID=259542 RepID=A0AAV3XWK3_9GAST|nr:hypothetical protein PoB_000094600 [Plakobranchus ocellatus]